MSSIEFTCLKCGNCCRELLAHDGIAGLMLFPNEVKLFQKRNIKPCLGIGKSSTHGSFKIFNYQLTEKICPHLKDNSCTIYQERPLMCKGYPLQVSDTLEEISYGTVPECTFINELTEKHPGRGTYMPAHSETLAARRVSVEKMRGYFILINRKNRGWIYNLKTEKWEEIHSIASFKRARSYVKSLSMNILNKCTCVIWARS